MPRQPLRSGQLRHDGTVGRPEHERAREPAHVGVRLVGPQQDVGAAARGRRLLQQGLRRLPLMDAPADEQVVVAPNRSGRADDSASQIDGVRERRDELMVTRSMAAQSSKSLTSARNCASPTTTVAAVPAAVITRRDRDHDTRDTASAATTVSGTTAL